VADPDPAPEIDWEQLRAEARAMAERAYAPYSGVRVGAAGLADDGRVVVGCNVENASIGIGICAEVNMAGHLVATGGGTLVAVVSVAGDGDALTPCGRCRQFLYEFGGAQILVDRPNGPVELGDLLPDAFGPEDVAARSD